MKERPILFNGAMVRAILDGSKTQTRRIVKQQPLLHTTHWDSSTSDPSLWMGIGPSEATGGTRQTWGWSRCPFGQVGDQLWARETFSAMGDKDIHAAKIYYRADGDDSGIWTPSIYMPRWASRIQLEITGVRVERLNSITNEDSIAEGAKFTDFGKDKCGQQRDGWRCDRVPTKAEDALGSARSAYANLWESINGVNSWDDNPWVWVIDFKRVAA